MHLDLVFSILLTCGNKPVLTKTANPWTLDFCFIENISKPGNSSDGMFIIFVSLKHAMSNSEIYTGKMS